MRTLLYGDTLPYRTQRVAPAIEPPPEIEIPPVALVKPRLPVDVVFACAVLSPTRLMATFYWARCQHHGHPLTLLDFDVQPLVADSWTAIEARLKVLTIERRARLGSLGCFVEDESLVNHARIAGLPAPLIPKYLVTPQAWPVLCQSAAGYLSRHDVGYTKFAVEKMDARPFLDAAGTYSGPRQENDPTVAAFLYGIVLALDPAAAKDPRPKPVIRSRK